MQHSRIKLIFLLVFRPSEFIAISEENVAWMNSEKGMEEKTKRISAPSYSEAATRAMRRALLTSLIYVLGSILLGVIVGRAIVAVELWEPLGASEIAQYVGIAILLWATLGKVGWDIQTLNGTTIPEQTNELLYRLLYVVGSFSLALSASLAFGTNRT